VPTGRAKIFSPARGAAGRRPPGPAASRLAGLLVASASRGKRLGAAHRAAFRSGEKLHSTAVVSCGSVKKPRPPRKHVIRATSPACKGGVCRPKKPRLHRTGLVFSQTVAFKDPVRLLSDRKSVSFVFTKASWTPRRRRYSACLRWSGAPPQVSSARSTILCGNLAACRTSGASGSWVNGRRAGARDQYLSGQVRGKWRRRLFNRRLS
jgi:hypothetical protein